MLGRLRRHVLEWMSGRLSLELYRENALKRDKPPRRLVDALATDREQPVVLVDGGLVSLLAMRSLICDGREDRGTRKVQPLLRRGIYRLGKALGIGCHHFSPAHGNERAPTRSQSFT